MIENDQRIIDLDVEQLEQLGEHQREGWAWGQKDRVQIQHQTFTSCVTLDKSLNPPCFSLLINKMSRRKKWKPLQYLCQENPRWGHRGLDITDMSQQHNSYAFLRPLSILS